MVSCSFSQRKFPGSRVTEGLQCPSRELLDGKGNRLYATFTRICLTTDDLSTYQENAPLRLEGEVSRFGSGMFFSDIDLTRRHAMLISSFSMRGESESNMSLLKGQPRIPADCKIAEQTSLPRFGEEYRGLRASGLPDSIFSTEYEIVPHHDINGVGLLYFAAYPIISDICESRFGSLRGLHTIRRDIFYFNNCDPDHTLVFRLHNRRTNNSRVESEKSICRKSDGVVMSRVFTTRK